LVLTEVPTKVLEEWLDAWRTTHQYKETLRVELRPQTPGSELLELALRNGSGEKVLNVLFSPVQDRSGRQLLAIRDQNTQPALRRKRLMTLVQVFLIHRYKAAALYYMTPTEDNDAQTRSMKKLGVFKTVNAETGMIIVAEVDQGTIAGLAQPDKRALRELIGLRTAAA
jgi:isocitrate lyase